MLRIPSALFTALPGAALAVALLTAPAVPASAAEPMDPPEDFVPVALEGRPVTEHVYPFRAFALEGEALLYRGEYVVRDFGALVYERHLYRTPAGDPVLEVDSLFDRERMRPLAYRSHSFRDGEEIRARLEDETFRYEITGPEGRVEHAGREDWQRAMFLWPNLIHVVQRHWEPMAAGEGVNLELFLFHRGKAYDFTLRKVGETTVAGREAARMELTPASWLLRALTRPSTLTFAADDPATMLEYTGRTAVTDEQGHTQDLRIVLDPGPAG